MDSLFVRNETTELWQNVTGTSVIINVDAESRYNASVSSWTRLGDEGVMIYISFTTTDAGAGFLLFKHFYEVLFILRVLVSLPLLTVVTWPPEPFDPPQNVTVTNVTASSVTLLWQPPTEPNGVITHYTIYYSDNNTVAEQVSHIYNMSNNLQKVHQEKGDKQSFYLIVNLSCY